MENHSVNSGKQIKIEAEPEVRPRLSWGQERLSRGQGRLSWGQVTPVRGENYDLFDHNKVDGPSR